MIFYFSGTGNSEWIARQMALKLGDEAVNIAEVMNQSYSFGKGERVGVVYPVYAWAPPEIVTTFAQKLKADDAFVYSICTYGGEPGNAMKVLSKSVHLDSVYALKMPNNYIVGMSVDSVDVAKSKVAAAKAKLERIAEEVRNQVRKNEVETGALAGVKSALAAAAFNRFGRNTKPFHAESACDGCGVCVKVCPTHTISLVEGKPVWGKKCYQCLACINRCPKQAIEYGKSSVGKGRYYFKDSE